MSTNKPHKGLQKRMRITKTGKVKHKPAGSKHLKSHKSAKRLRGLAQDKYLWSSQTKPLEKLLFRRLRGKDQPRTAVRKSPSPAERKAALEAKRSEAGKSGATGSHPASKPTARGGVKGSTTIKAKA